MSRFDVVAGGEGGHLRTEMLTVNCGGGRTLPVFSGEGEAEMFVWLEGAFEDGWQVRETSTGELVSILCGPCVGVRSVALDPSPGMAKAEMIGLVTVARKRFLDRIVALAVEDPSLRQSKPPSLPCKRQVGSWPYGSSLRGDDVRRRGGDRAG